MGIMCQAFLVTLLVSILATSLAETVLINDGESLMKYLCSPSGTIPPNTNLQLNNSSFTIDGRHPFCLFENTSNITIAPSQELLENGHNHVEVQCSDGSGGFGFFNVSNLTISLIMFNDCAGVIPASAVRYVNDSDQHLLYNTPTNTTFLFNHCYNLKLKDLIPRQKSTEFSIIGINLCDHSRISVSASVNLHESNSKTLLYFTNSALTSSSPKCNLYIEHNSVLQKSPIFFVPEFEAAINDFINSDNIPISSILDGWFTLLVSQQQFNANVDMIMRPTAISSTNIPVYIAFVNSITDSQVTFQGIPYSYCLDESITDLYFAPLSLNVFYMETPSFNHSVSEMKKSLIINNTSLIFYTHITDPPPENPLFFMLVALRNNISHEIKMENISWCTKNIGSTSHSVGNQIFINPYGGLFLSINYGFPIQVKIINAYMHCGASCPLTAMEFISLNVTMSGMNYFTVDSGQIMSFSSSTLTITGNLTVRGAYNYNIQGGGGISLDKSSALFLKEPLEARFYNNTATQGSAIYAEGQRSAIHAEGQSPIQIVPNRIYSLHNVTDMSVALYFENNTNFLNVENSLYAPSLFYDQRSPNFNIHSYNRSYSIFPVILKEMTELDKYTSLPNGICWQLHGKQWNCNYASSLAYGQYAAQFYSYPGEKAISMTSTYDQVFSALQVSCSSVKDFPVIGHFDGILSKRNSTVSAIFRNKKGKNICIIIHRYSSIPDTNFDFYVTVNEYCPHGFNLSEEGYCNCTSVLQDHGYKCDIDTRIFTSPRYHWTGYQQDNSSNATILFVTNCPPGYCDPGFHSFILSDSITHLSCLNHHTGILCGQCKENYSAVFGSDVCYDNCTDLYLLTLLMYATAGLILVVLLFALRLTVATGTINGVIFYANILGLSMDLLTRDYHGPYLKFLHTVISLLNLDLGFPLCFYEGMTTTAKVGLQFIFPVYLWSIVIGMIIIANHSVRVSNLISKSSVQVLATLFYLSFSKLLRTVIDILSHTTLYSITCHQHDYSNLSEQSVWYYNGEEYGHGVHGFYLFLATAFVVLFLLPYTILVTFSYCFTRFKLVNKFKPFIDAYNGHFKDKWRFWFGLRLWITITLFIVSGILQGTNTEIMLTIHRLTILIFIILQCLCCPFKNRIIWFTDTLFMVDYWLIIEFYFTFHSALSVAYIFLVSLAIFMLFLITLFHCSHKCRKQNFFLQIRNRLFKRLNGYEVIGNEMNYEVSEDENRELFIAAKERERQN